ncbi:hypothetical protein HG421_16785 [Xanthomonas campestris pv. badrii]|uniref:Uncharacterized protein n=1 Tax=Xanthomonas campestris pv. badrii TaxID=149696 RepID=A0A7Z2ZI47_XANCA|nr:hypothetical protein [Xanthomonas campestris]QJD69194.1 hypothetical protein HG421_16785 [Xanthomonas campestris pv. badrii]
MSQDVVEEKPRSSTAYSRDAAQPTRASGTALYSQKEFQDIFFSIRDIARKEGYESALKIPSYKIPGLPCTALDSHPKGVRVKGGDLFNGLSIFYDCGSFAMEVATTDFTMATDQQMMVKIAEETSTPITGGSIFEGLLHIKQRGHPGRLYCSWERCLGGCCRNFRQAVAQCEVSRWASGQFYIRHYDNAASEELMQKDRPSLAAGIMSPEV